MTSRDFCFWLQGYIEVAASHQAVRGLTDEQFATVRRHLALVFKHEIDPSMGGPLHQAVLDAAHGPSKIPDAPLMRC